MNKAKTVRCPPKNVSSKRPGSLNTTVYVDTTGTVLTFEDMRFPSTLIYPPDLNEVHVCAFENARECI